jgi:propionyl-CoA carboxylase alpha chain
MTQAVSTSSSAAPDGAAMPAAAGPSGGAGRSGPGLPAKVLIANRGEIAVRIARTCRAMGIGTVAVHSDVDEHALHVAACDEAVRLGGASPAESYLRGDALVEAALRTGAEAIHPGYGFLSEAAGFARQVRDAGLTWVGPSPEAIAAMGDKLAAKARMAAAGVPLVPGMDLAADLDAVTELDLDHVAADIGFPVMVKAAAGGGGKGMRVVHDPAELHDAIASARREAGGAFGDDRVFLERYVAHPRHLEVQVIGDAHGTVLHLFERECSVQRRHQKVVEETPSPGITPAVREALGQAAVAAARAIRYVNAGTIEFIADDAVLTRLRDGDASVDPHDAFAFLEVNTRLQVEHPVTEEVVRVVDRSTGGLERLDLVRLQLLVAAGEPLPFAQDAIVQRGHAIEVRLYAEDPTNDYLPQTGTLHAYAPASLPGVRWDSGVRAGDQIPTHYDPMLAKVIAWAPSRREAARLLARELDTSVLVGATTNRDLLVAVLRDPVFLAGDTTTSFLGQRFPGGQAVSGGAGGDGGDSAEAVGAGDSAEESTVALPSAAVVRRRTALIASTVSGALARRASALVLGTLPAGFTNAQAFDQATVFDVDGEPTTVRYRQARDGGWRVRLVPGDAPEDDGPHREASEHRVVVHAAGDGAVARVLGAARTVGAALGGRGYLAAGGKLGSGTHLAADADAAAAVPTVLDLEVDGHRQRVTIARAGGEVHVGTTSGRVVVVERPRFPTAAGEEVAGATLAPMPGAVVLVAVEPGAVVGKGDLLVTVEAMKMEHRITAPFAGTVGEVRVAAGDQVDAEQVLVLVEADVAVGASGSSSETPGDAVQASAR